MKIKKVEIQAFRAYQQKSNGTFDFMVLGKDGNNIPANFISLYAPNGFGKSSFYDAVEWAMTNGSERFSDGIYETAARGSKNDDEALRILRNIEAPNDLETSVLVVTTTQNFERKPGKIRKDGIDVDFKKKKLAEGFEEYRRIFLSQEAIDFFIRGIDPEDRYQTFIEVYGEETELLRRDVQALYLDLGEKIEKSEKLENSLRLEIEIPVDNFLINKFLEIANDLRKIGIPIEKLPNKIRDTKFDELTEELTTKAAQIQHTLEMISKREQALNELTAGIENNHRSSNELSTQIKEENFLIQAIEDIDKRTALIRSQQEYKLEIDNTENEIQKSKVAKLHLEKYRLLNQSRLALLREIDFENLQIRNYQLSINEIDTCKTELKKLQDDLQHRKASYELLKYGAKNVFETIDKLLDEQNQLKEKLEINNEILFSQSTKLAEKETLLSTINKSKKNIHDLSINDITLFGLSTDVYFEIKSKTDEIHFIENTISSIDLDINSLQSHSNSFDRLVALAGEILKTHPGSNCPLCQKEHYSLKELEESIYSNNKITDILKEKLEQRSLEALKLSDSKKKLEIKASLLAKQKIDFLKKLELDINALINSILHIEKENNSIERRLELSHKELVSNKAVILNLSPEKLSIKVDGEIETLTKEIDKNQNKIFSSNKEYERLITANLVSNTKITELKKSLIDIESRTEYFLVLNHIKEHNLNHERLDEEFSKIESVYINKIKKIRGLFLATQNSIVSIEKKFNEENITLDINVLKSKLASCLDRTTELNKRIDSYNSRFKSLVGVSILDNVDHVSKLNIAIQNTLNEKEKNNNYSETLAQFTALFDAVKPLINREILIVQLNSLIEEQKKHEKLRAKVGVELQAINEVLERQLDSVFQTDLINEIYRKIDPHPGFSQVKFTCGFGLRSKPTLNVMLKNNDSEKQISPLLYFSAAQLNILSLSIFLARALSAKSPSGMPLDLILIDDPIHSMDSINILSTIDLLRGIALNHNKQIIISTHDENFYELLKKKIPSELCQSKFLKLRNLGHVEVDI
ncbi:AAA family ATPase [Pantoea agglomerans]|uniref:AAA family ATPase n=1 Tax=Enterobacter agglomerans TaxID=549 RepID=UPI002A6A0AA0|nr:AAA family ATPase [Pantoea agglomerans]MDY1000639.1 AAA family ATPase [Pantoea agglomerans]